MALARVGKRVHYAPPGSCKLGEMYRPLLVNRKTDLLTAPRRSSMVERQTSIAFLSLLGKVHSMGIPINWEDEVISPDAKRGGPIIAFSTLCAATQSF